MTENFRVSTRTLLRVAAIGGLAAALAACQGSRMGSLDSRPVAAAPAPLPAAPAGTVTSNQLPPPSSPNAFPEAPQTAGQQVAALDPAAAEAGAPELTKSALVGSWNVSGGGGSCQMFMTLTKFGNASRGGTRGCSGDLARMKGWEVSGKQVVVLDDTGNTIARLYGSGAERYSGQTSGGQPVNLSR